MIIHPHSCYPPAFHFVPHRLDSKIRSINGEGEGGEKECKKIPIIVVTNTIVDLEKEKRLKKGSMVRKRGRKPFDQTYSRRNDDPF